MDGIYIKDEQGWLSRTLVGFTQRCLVLEALGINYARLHLKIHVQKAACQLMVVYYLFSSCWMLSFMGKELCRPFPQSRASGRA